MMKHRLKLQRKLFLLQVVLKTLNKKIEIAPEFPIFVTNLSYEHHQATAFPSIHPPVPGHEWACLVNRTGPSNR